MKNILVLILLFSSSLIFGQLPDGSTAPDWTVMDLDGNTHNLYDVLDDGKSVIIDFSATWCGICWNYHKTNALEDVYSAFGPAGTDVTRVYWMDADATTNDACVTNSAGCNNNTKGDWTEGSAYPYINLTDDELMVKSDYMINSYPTIIAISPNKKQYEIGKETDQNVWDSWLNETFALDYNVNVGSDFIDLEVTGGFGEIEYEWSNGETTQDISNLVEGFYSCTITEGRGHSVETISYQILNNGITMVCPSLDTQTAECSKDEIPTYTNALEFFEAGGDIIGQYVPESFQLDELLIDNGCPKIVNRIYSVQDVSGNVYTCSQSFNIVDTESPQNSIEIIELINESEIESSVINDIDEFIQVGLITDNCNTDFLSVNMISEESNNEICQQITRTYSVSDFCENSSTFQQILRVELNELASLTYVYENEGLVFEFSQSNNFGSEDVYWDFGDGTDILSELSPTHEFSEAGDYEVCLTAFSPCGPKTICETVEVSGINNISDLKNKLTVYPNPFNSKDGFIINSPLNNVITAEMYDINGKNYNLIKNSNHFSPNITLNTGVYTLKIETNKGEIIWKKIIVE